MTLFRKIRSLFQKDVAIDLGTANTLIMVDGKIELEEPSIVALNRTTGKVTAVGKEALMMHEKTHSEIRTIRPLKDGVIADMDVAEQMIREFIRKIHKGSPLIMPSYRMVICIPSGVTDVEERAVRNAAEHAGAKEVYLIHEPMAAAIGINLNVEEPKGHMIIDIGGGTTEIAVISLGGIVCGQSIRTAGDELNEDIRDYIRQTHNLNIGERTAENIKIKIGSALTELENPPEDMEIRGKDVMNGIPRTMRISYKEIAHAINRSIQKIEEAVLKALEATPPELASDIHEHGIYLTGGGALLRGLDKRIQEKTKIPVKVADDPLRAVVKGTGIALANIDHYKFLLF
jgi:rod shape-determining protein MreB